MKGDKLVYYILMGTFVVGVIAIVGLWYLILLAIALIIFIFVLVALKRQNSEPISIRRLDAKVLIPLEHWVESREAPISTGAELASFRLVNTSEYSENWEYFRAKAQVSGGEKVRVETTLLCIFDVSASENKIVIAYDQRVLAEFAAIDLEGVFEPLARAGGIFRVPCEFRFSKAGDLEQSQAFIQADLDPHHDPKRSVDLLQLWTMIWNGVRGKS